MNKLVAKLLVAKLHWQMFNPIQVSKSQIVHTHTPETIERLL